VIYYGGKQMSDHHYLVRFLPSGREIETDEGKTVLQTAQGAGIYIESPCGGQGKCGKCKVRVGEGALSPLTDEELSFIPQGERGSGIRLACRAVVESDSSIFIPDEYLLTREASKKTFSGRVTTPRPAVVSRRLDLRGRKGLGGIAALLREQYGLEDIAVGKACLEEEARILKEPWPEAIAFVWMDKEVVRINPAGDDAMLGVALDVGTTTVAVYLCDLGTGEVVGSGSFANPQIVFGADVISRISYSVRNRDAGIAKMREGLLLSVNGMIRELTRDAGFTPSQVLDMTAVGNTVMHHIFLNVPPDKLGLSPFQPTIRTSVDVKARDLGIEINPESYVHVLPVEAGFVGADNVAVILSEEPYGNEEPTLIIDIGTNGEIVLGNRERLFSCSCATGPALEGAGISQGVRAVKGAIERIRIDRDTREADYQVVGEEGWASAHKAGELKPTGICGSGIIDAVAELYTSGVIDEKGTFKEGLATPRLRRNESGFMEFVLAWPPERAAGPEIAITQRDIRQFQLAKGALRAGCEVLMKRYGIDSVKRIVIAGAFGVHIDKSSALTSGLLPPCDPEHIYMVGNAAGHGAYLALMDRGKRQEADVIARRTTYVELASDKDFQPIFIKALAIPYGP
jgi:uncharacterized 2Fe-2S/4Fe-4S cluster protein (DUF4445 family)